MNFWVLSFRFKLAIVLQNLTLEYIDGGCPVFCPLSLYKPKPVLLDALEI
jgi:hypothetical protein